jgi:DivIVA domain-containing protein
MGARRLSPDDIQAKEFRIARFRGYKEREVDEFLDEITIAWTALLEENRRLLEENRRLRERSTQKPAEPDEAARRADEIIAQAREEADRVLLDAETRATGIAAGSMRSGERKVLSAFISKEREFLQSLAALGQNHAETVKGMAREVFARSAPAESAEPAKIEETVPVEGTAEIEETVPVEETAKIEEMVPVEETAEPPASEEPVPEEPIVLDDAEPAGVRSENDPPEPKNVSLRELFWGED